MNRLKLCIAAFALFVCIPVALAQDTLEHLEARQQQILRLDDLVLSLEKQQDVRSGLQAALTLASPENALEIQERLKVVSQDIRELRSAIEQIAVGSVDLDVFMESSESVDWQAELNQVMLPLLQGLKRVTEKPRKIENLRATISQATEQKQLAGEAAANIRDTIQFTESPVTQETLQALAEKWLEQEKLLDLEIELAENQLSNLQQTQISFWYELRQAIGSFLKGRGLTLLLAVLAGFAIYFSAQFLAQLFLKRGKVEDVKAYRTRQRIIHYGLKAVRTLSILLAIVVVFYLRDDYLLLAIAFLIASGLIVSLRHTIPRYFDEMRLLLNLGSIREDERVMYQGLPWKVSSLNVHSVLSNPEIMGVLRIPLKEMLGLTSRPAGNEPWFPASKDDYILMDDTRMLQVVRLTPEHVTLENLAGTRTMIATAEFYTMVFENLTRSQTYFVSSVFGIGYSHQSDSVVHIPEKLKEALSSALQASDLADSVESVSVELQEAGSSSLDYWLGVKMKSDAATALFRIKRLIQQVCVSTCTQEGWDIPFPQLTLHNQ